MDSCNIFHLNQSSPSELHLAVLNGDCNMVRVLIKSGADVNIRDKKSWTPLHYAAMYQKSTKIAELLVREGADVNGADFMGRRPLHLACTGENKECVTRMLLRCGAYVDARDELGNSALANAIRFNLADSIAELIAYGADIDIIIDNLSFHLDAYRGGANILIKHWIKLRAAGLRCSHKYEAFIEGTCDYYLEYYQSCLSETAKLKSTLIGIRGTSLYECLRSPLNRLRSYVNDNENLGELLESPDFSGQYPEYPVVIRARYREAVARPSLVKAAREAWCELTNGELPDEIDYVLAYLSNADLMSLKDSTTVRDNGDEYLQSIFSASKE